MVAFNMPSYDCRETMHCVYFENKNNFIVWILTEFVIFILVTVCTAVQILLGAELTKGDKVFIAAILGACIVAIIITIVCRLKVRERYSDKNQQRWRCCGNDVDSRVKVVSQKMGSDCAICLEEKNVTGKPVVEITCKHTYHKSCISECLEIDRTAKCPQCRRPLGQFSTTERFVAFIHSLTKGCTCCTSTTNLPEAVV